MLCSSLILVLNCTALWTVHPITCRFTTEQSTIREAVALADASRVRGSARYRITICHQQQQQQQGACRRQSEATMLTHPVSRRSFTCGSVVGASRSASRTKYMSNRRLSWLVSEVRGKNCDIIQPGLTTIFSGDA